MQNKGHLWNHRYAKIYNGLGQNLGESCTAPSMWNRRWPSALPTCTFLLYWSNDYPLLSFWVLCKNSRKACHEVFCSLKYFSYLKIIQESVVPFQLILSSKERLAIAKGFLFLDVESGQRLYFYQLGLICQFSCVKEWLNSSLFLTLPLYTFINRSACIYTHRYIYIYKKNINLREGFMLWFRGEEITIYSGINSITLTHS